MSGLADQVDYFWSSGTFTGTPNSFPFQFAIVTPGRKGSIWGLEIYFNPKYVLYQKFLPENMLISKVKEYSIIHTAIFKGFTIKMKKIPKWTLIAVKTNEYDLQGLRTILHNFNN